MDFTVVFYTTGMGRCPVQEFLDDLKASNPGDFAAVVAGLVKLRNSQYHREPLSKAIGDGLFELRHVANSTAAFCGVSRRAAASFCCTLSATKARQSPPAI